MSLLVIPNTFSAGAVIVASQHNSNFSTIYNDYNGGIIDANISTIAAIAYSKLALTGNITNNDINASAAIADSKLAQITTASKVSGTAITGLASLPAGAGVVPTANLGSGTANSSTVLYGDQTYKAVSAIPQNIQVFTSSGTWTKPAGVSTVYVKVWGGGGNGVLSSNAAGGGAGGYAEGLIAVTGNVTVTVGAATQTSSFAGSTTIQATGGTNATSGNPGVGGTGSNGSINLTGDSGQPVGSIGNPGTSAMGGSAPFGGRGGNGTNVASVFAQNGQVPGGGGGGASGTAGAGSGAGGMVIVYY